jgi:formylglycine-generating enzyme required for sulfatase activity
MKTGRWLGSEDDQLDVPVVGVTAVEAALAAAHLGGRLPTYDLWRRAAGFGTDPRAGPAGNKPFDFTRLALRLDRGPWPVTRATEDVSVFGVRQLVSNGMEWTRDTKDGRQLNPLAPRAGGLIDPLMRAVGESWDAGQVPTFAEFHDRSHYWNDTGAGIGFRVVLEQPLP